jgi:hypothetical protein
MACCDTIGIPEPVDSGCWDTPPIRSNIVLGVGILIPVNKKSSYSYLKHTFSGE